MSNDTCGARLPGAPMITCGSVKGHVGHPHIASLGENLGFVEWSVDQGSSAQRVRGGMQRMVSGQAPQLARVLGPPGSVEVAADIYEVDEGALVLVDSTLIGEDKNEEGVVAVFAAGAWTCVMFPPTYVKES